MTNDDATVEFDEHSPDELRTAMDLAVTGAAALGQTLTKEREAALAAREADVRAIAGDARDHEPEEIEWPDAQRLEESLDAAMEETRDDGPPRSLSFVLPPPAGVVLSAPYAIKNPPYDSQWAWGNARVRVSDRIGGLVQIDSHSRQNQNPTNSACGVGFGFRTEARAMVQVRPFFDYRWAYATGADHVLSHASCTGGLDLAAFHGDQPVSEVLRLRLFRRRVSVGEYRTDAGQGVASGADFQIDFLAQPGVRYAINVGAWLDLEHRRGATPSGNAFARAQIRGHVKWVIIQRYLPS